MREERLVQGVDAGDGCEPVSRQFADKTVEIARVGNQQIRAAMEQVVQEIAGQR